MKRSSPGPWKLVNRWAAWVIAAMVFVAAAPARADCKLSDLDCPGGADVIFCKDYQACICTPCEGANAFCEGAQCRHYCTRDEDCGPGIKCPDERVCPLPQGTRCTYNGQCKAGEVCSAAGSCEPWINPGEDPSCTCKAAGDAGPLAAPCGALLAACAALAMRRRRR